jgi:hypothetical protein
VQALAKGVKIGPVGGKEERPLRRGKRAALRIAPQEGEDALVPARQPQIV